MKEELEHIKSFNEFQLVQYFLDGLIARATGGDYNYQTYMIIRTKLIDNKTIEKQLPSWVITNRTLDDFWTFIKGRFDNYKDRREFLKNEFSKLLYFLETKTTSPLIEKIAFDEAHIHSIWEKALERKSSEPEGAITSARTLIESTLKHILDEQKIEYNENAELPELYREVAKSLNLAPEQHHESIFKQILGGASGIISGLGAIRNKLGDAHGKSKNSVKPSERHSELAVNLAGTMAVFLFKTYNAQSKKLFNE